MIVLGGYEIEAMLMRKNTHVQNIHARAKFVNANEQVQKLMSSTKTVNE